MKISGPHDLEQFSFEIQKLLARLQDRGVHSIGHCTLYLETLDHRGGRVVLQDEQGKPLETLDINHLSLVRIHEQ